MALTIPKGIKIGAPTEEIRMVWKVTLGMKHPVVWLKKTLILVVLNEGNVCIVVLMSIVRCVRHYDGQIPSTSPYQRTRDLTQSWMLLDSQRSKKLMSMPCG